MYKFKSYLMSMLAVGSMAFLSSCGDDDEVNPKANIVFTPSETTATKNAGEMVTLGVSVTSTDKLKSFKAERFILGNGDLLEETTNFPGAGYTYALMDTVPGDAQPGNVIEYRFTAVTNKNETTTKSYTVTVGGAANTFNGILYNLAAPTGQFGSFDLVNNTGVASSAAAANKDMINLTITSGTGAAEFVAGWKAGNATRFVKAPSSYTFEGANSTNAASTYAAGSETETVNSAAANEVYIAKLRGTTDYAVIKITNIVNDNEVGPNKNSDNIQFIYKKF